MYQLPGTPPPPRPRTLFQSFPASAEGSASRAACTNRATRDRPRLDDGGTSPGLLMLRKARNFCEDWHSRGRLAKRLLSSKTTVLKFPLCNCVPEVPSNCKGARYPARQFDDGRVVLTPSSKRAFLLVEYTREHRNSDSNGMYDY